MSEVAGGAGGFSVDATGKAVESAVSAAATTGITIGVGAAIGNAIPIPGLGALIGAVVGAIVAGFNALGNALKSKFHPYPVDASAEMLILAHIDPHAFFASGTDAASNSHDFVRLIRYFRVRSGVVPKGYLGNNDQLYDPVSSWARPWAGVDCGNPYLCANDPLDPMTSESHIQQLMDSGPKAPMQVSHPKEAQTILKLLRDHIKPIGDAFSKLSHAEREKIRSELVTIRVLANEYGDDPALSKVFGSINVLPKDYEPGKKSSGAMSWTYNLTYQNGSTSVYAKDVPDEQTVGWWDAVNWGADPKLARADRTSDTGQTVNVYVKKTASGPGDSIPGWVPPVLAGAAVIGAFGLGMWFLRTTKTGAFELDPYRIHADPFLGKSAPDLAALERDYPTNQTVSYDPATGVAVVWFKDEQGKPQHHEWQWTGDSWVCAKDLS